MKSIGLMPSSTGEVGGKETGQHMGDYMAESGLIVDLYKQYKKDGVFIPWYERLSIEHNGELPDDVPQDLEIELEENSNYQSGTTRSRYAHKCDGEKRATIVYGKPDLSLVCGLCGEAWIEDIK